MKIKNESASQSAFFNLRVLLAFALCSVGALLAMFSLGATPPVETTRANSSVPPDPANFLSTVGSNANRLPPGVPLPPGTQFSLNEQGGPSSSSLTAGFPRFAGTPLRPGTGNGFNSLGNPVFANQQLAPLSVPRPAASESMPLTPAAAGSWSIVPSPNISPSGGNRLYGVTCVSTSDCWAVGNYYDNSTNLFLTLTEHYDGTAWSIVSSPNGRDTGNNFLYGVACGSTSDCWAVGYFAGVGAFQTLIEHYDGTAWSVISSPNAPSVFNSLNGVTCLNASDCWAVGDYRDESTNIFRTLTEHYDGTTWSIVSSSNTSSSQHNVLYGITCVSASDCWTVGSYSASHDQTLIEHYDGTTWSIVSSPNTSSGEYNNLYSVTCVSANDCRAVGTHYNTSGGAFTKTLIEQYTPTSGWAIVDSPNPGLYANGLSLSGSATCASDGNCWAIGSYSNGPGTGTFTLIVQDMGSGWALVDSPNVSLNDVLFGVTCPSTSECWAVGYYNNGNVPDQTLVLRYTASPTPTPLSAVSRKIHGGAGTFDVPLPLTGNVGIECRSGGATNDYQLIIDFANPVTVGGASVTSGTGKVSSFSVSGPEVTVNLTGVTNTQRITVTLSDVNDGTNTGDVPVSMGVLVGDVGGNAVVNAADVSQTKSQSGQAVTTANFREDVNANGTINASDVSLVKAQSGTALP